MADQAKMLHDLLAAFYGRLGKVLRDAVQQQKQAADIAALIAALKRKDINAALRALNIDPAHFTTLSETLRAAFIEAGIAAASALPSYVDGGVRAAFTFDVRNPRAERWIAKLSSDLIAHITETTRDAVRVALLDGMEAGRNPRRTALDVVGRLNVRTRQRVGGVIGLTPKHAESVMGLRRALESGDYEAWFSRELRDRRFDRTVRRLMRDGGSLPADKIDAMVTLYQSRYELYRGEMIARTESLSALNAASHEAAQQAVQRAGIDQRDVRRVWQSAGDGRVRDTHRAMHGQIVGLNEPFRSPSGATLRFPGDPGAPAEERIHCRCIAITRIDFLSNAGRAAA